MFQIVSRKLEKHKICLNILKKNQSENVVYIRVPWDDYKHKLLT